VTTSGTGAAPSGAWRRPWQVLAMPTSPNRVAVALGVAALAAVLAARPGDAMGAPPRPVPVPRSSLGVNVGQVNYYNTQVAFLDLVKQAPDWGLGSNGQPVAVDGEGWPTSLRPGQAARVSWGMRPQPR